MFYYRGENRTSVEFSMEVGAKASSIKIILTQEEMYNKIAIPDDRNRFKTATAGTIA